MAGRGPLKALREIEWKERMVFPKCVRRPIFHGGKINSQQITTTTTTTPSPLSQDENQNEDDPEKQVTLDKNTVDQSLFSSKTVLTGQKELGDDDEWKCVSWHGYYHFYKFNFEDYGEAVKALRKHRKPPKMNIVLLNPKGKGKR
jgi:hypothetical protein